MATHTEILDKVSLLSVVSAELVEEIASLEGGRAVLDERFNTNLSHLNQAIAQLPVVIDVLMLKKPPTRLRLTSAGGLLVAMGAVLGIKTRHSTVRTVTAKIFRVESDMRASQTEASEKKIATADLASKTAEHIALCSSLSRTVSDAQSRTQCSIKAANRQIAKAQQEIDDTKRTASEMANRAREHDGRAEANRILFWSTFWIPIVNAVTIPISLGREAESKKIAESCRATEATLTAEIETKSFEKLSLEITRSELNTALANLSQAQSQAERQARHAEGLRDQAKALTDKYGVLTTRLRDVLRALDCLSADGEVSVEGWMEARVLGLMALRGMVFVLREGGMLAPECEGVLERLEGVVGWEESGSGGLEELEF